MDLTMNYVGLFIAVGMFVVATVLSIVGLVSNHWMIQESSLGGGVKVGIFEICFKATSAMEKCVETSNERNLIADETRFIACRILIIAGVALAASSAVGGVVFFVLNGKRHSPNKGSFMTTMICAISSFLCIGGGVIIFGALIYDPDYSIEYPFILNCAAAGLMLFGSIIFPIATSPILADLQQRSQASGVVMSQFNPPLQHGTQQPFSVGGHPSAVQYNYYTPGPQYPRSY